MSSLLSRRSLIANAASAILLPGSALISCESLAADLEPAIATTRYGRVKGLRAGGSCVFKGIPYARTLKRLAPAVPPEKWSGVRDAIEFGPRAYQVAASTAGMSESCQMLNVWTPSVGHGKRPVMVWLHGGGFMNGSANTDLYDGTDLNRDGDVVVVTLNHRLGAFGYLHLPDAGTDHASSGCVGMLDIVSALRWVRDNIEYFGGDPQKVTIFGESGGGGKVIALMAMPAAKGLFHRAIVQSGALLRTAISVEEGQKNTSAVLAEMKLSATQYQKLLDAPAEELLKAQAAVLARAGTPGSGGSTAQRPFSPVMGRELPEQPFDPRAPKISADVPLIIGTNKEETRFFFVGSPELYALESANLRGKLEPLLGANTDKVIDLYRATRPNASASDLYFAISTAQMYGYTSTRVAQRKAEQDRAPVYMYQFAYEGTQTAGNPPVEVRAGHSMEIPFVFGHPRATANQSGADQARAAQERVLSNQMSRAWIAFARTGDPNHAEMIRWPRYTSQRRATMIFDVANNVVDAPNERERQLWDQLLTAR